MIQLVDSFRMSYCEYVRMYVCILASVCICLLVCVCVCMCVCITVCLTVFHVSLINISVMYVCVSIQCLYVSSVCIWFRFSPSDCNCLSHSLTHAHMHTHWTFFSWSRATSCCQQNVLSELERGYHMLRCEHTQNTEQRRVMALGNHTKLSRRRDRRLHCRM